MARKLILIADEDPDILGLLKRSLSSAGHAVETVRDGHKAIEAVANNRPDLIILDVLLPGLNGYQVCRKIVQDPNLKVPVVFVSSKTEPADRFWAQELGARKFVDKPFDVRSLVQTIEHVLEETDESDP